MRHQDRTVWLAIAFSLFLGLNGWVQAAPVLAQTGSWLAQHGVFMRQNRNSYKACHGLDLHGTVLSRAKADRTLSRSISLGGVTTIAKGSPAEI